MKRTVLLEQLKFAKRALATKDAIPALTCLFFDGSTVLATDNVIAVEQRCTLPIKGGVSGRLLVQYLSSVTTEDVDVISESGTTIVKAKRSKLKLPVMGRDLMVFSMPQTASPAFTIRMNESPEFLEALRRCLPSMGTDPISAQRNGILLVSEQDHVTLYSCDNRTASRAEAPWKTEGEPVTVSLPPAFTECLVDFAAERTPLKLRVLSNAVLASFQGGLRLHGALASAAIESDIPQLFEEKDQLDGKTVPVPPALLEAVERALIAVGSARDPYTTLTAKEGKLVCRSRAASQGETVDVLKIDPRLAGKIRVPPAYLKRALPLAESLAISQDNVALVAPHWLHLIAAYYPPDASDGAGVE